MRTFDESNHQLRGRCSQYIEYTINLIHFTLAWKQRILRIQLIQHTSDAPNIHLFVVIPISKQTFWGTVPTCGDVLGVGLRGVYIWLNDILLLQEPKSANFIYLSPETKMFSGLISL